MNKTIALALPLLCATVLASAASAQTMSHTAPTTPGASTGSTMAPATTTPATPPSSMSGGSMAGGSMASGSPADLSAADKRFIDKAAIGGMAEVQLAQLAQTKSQDQKVKTFAQKMIDDHTPNNEQLMKLASAKGVTPPSALDDVHQKEMTKLQGLDGAKFDKAYLKGQVKDHAAMLKLFETEAKSGHDADLKQFAASTVPVVQSHEDMAKSDM